MTIIQALLQRAKLFAERDCNKRKSLSLLVTTNMISYLSNQFNFLKEKKNIASIGIRTLNF